MSEQNQQKKSPQNQPQNPNPFIPPFFNFGPCIHYPFCSMTHYDVQPPYYNFQQLRGANPLIHAESYPPMRSKIKTEPIQAIDLQNDYIEKTEQKLTRCQCSKSHCLKQYCYCFKSGAKCNQKCGCNDCKNDQDELNQKRNPLKHKKTVCKCSKSQCAKKYCECYSLKKKCQAACLCIGCLN